MMDENRQAEIIALAADAKDFLNSHLGKYLMERAENDMLSAQTEFARVDPEDSVSIRALQTKIKRYHDFKHWLTTALEAGDVVYEQFINNQHPD